MIRKNLTEIQRRFAEEYVYGDLLPLRNYSEMFDVPVNTLTNWLGTPMVQEYIRSLRQTRIETLQSIMREKVELAVNEIADVAKLDAHRIVNKGRKTEHKVLDPMLIDRKLKAADMLVRFGSSGEIEPNGSSASAPVQVNVNTNVQTNQNAVPPTLKEIEELLQQRHALNDGERIVEAEAVEVEKKPEGESGNP